MASLWNTTPGASLPTWAHHQGGPTTHPSDGSDVWKQYYADHGALNQQRALQQEGKKLWKVLDAAFPGSKRDSWSRNELEVAVECSRQAYESKERIAGGKPRRLFHSVVRQLDAHSSLCQVLPSGNTYASLVIGAVTALVKVSIHHTKTIDELSHALAFIGEAVELCSIDARLIVSDLVQTAIAKLYVEVFQFYANAIIWYDSSRWSKIGKSLRKDFSQDFRDALDTIKEKTELVRHAAELGSRAEARVMGSKMDRLLDESSYGRAQQLTEHRHLIALIQQQDRSLQDLHMLIATGTPLRGSSPVPGYDNHLQLPAGSPCISATVLAASIPLNISVSKIRAWLSQLISRLPPTDELRAAYSQPLSTQSTPLFESQLAQSINKWLSSPDMPLCCLEYRAVASAARSDDASLLVSKQIVRVVQKAELPTIIYAQKLLSQKPSGDEGEDVSVVHMMLSIARDIFDLLPEDSEQPPCPIWTELEQQQQQQSESFPVCTFSRALDIFRAALAAAPQDLHVVIIGHPCLSNITSEAAHAFLDTLRSCSSSGGVKTLILSQQRKLVSLSPHLRAGESQIVMSSSSRGSVAQQLKQQQSRIVFRGGKKSSVV